MPFPLIWKVTLNPLSIPLVEGWKVPLVMEPTPSACSA